MLYSSSINILGIAVFLSSREIEFLSLASSLNNSVGRRLFFERASEIFLFLNELLDFFLFVFFSVEILSSKSDIFSNHLY